MYGPQLPEFTGKGINQMPIFQYLPTLELLFFNLFTIDRCCHRKYSFLKTFLMLFLFSAVLFGISYTFAEELSFQGDGSLSLYGLVFLIPFRYLYREKLPLLFIIVCTCWVYTLGILSLSIQIAGMLEPGSWFFIWTIQNLLYLLTLVPFYKHLVPKYIFVIEHISLFDKRWYKYMVLNNCLSFLLLVVINWYFLKEETSFEKILILFLLLSIICVSYLILYQIVLDAIKINDLKQEVSHDPLTGLRNRAQLWTDLQSVSKTGQTFSVLFMDLDRFKFINDQYGHIAGDQYLNHFARISSDILRELGRVYRFGGDEFVAVCPGVIPQEIIGRLKECREWDSGAPCPFNQVSIGVLLCEPPHSGVEEILQRVDRLMYQNKTARAVSGKA